MAQTLTFKTFLKGVPDRAAAQVIEYTVKKLQVTSFISLTPPSMDFYGTRKKTAVKREDGGIDDVLDGKPATGGFKRREVKGKERLA